MEFVTLIGPTVTGDCKENEHPSASTRGNIEQGTANGLLVWNDAKRFAMFTNGSNTWYGCKSGVKQAPSAEAFDCDAPPPTATVNTVALKADAVYLDPRELVADPKAFVGKNIFLQGRALNVTHNDPSASTPSYTWTQIMAQVRARTSTESIVVEFYPKDPKFLKDECYRIYGMVTGTQSVRRTLTGATNEAAVVKGYLWEKSPVGQYNVGCAAP